MLGLYELILQIQNEQRIKCLHNEFHIIMFLYQNGPSSASTLEKITTRSPAGHRNDISRLVGNGILECSQADFDKRVRLYDLSKDTRIYLDRMSSLSSY